MTAPRRGDLKVLRKRHRPTGWIFELTFVWDGSRWVYLRCIYPAPEA